MDHDLWEWQHINTQIIDLPSGDLQWKIYYSKIPGRKHWLGIGVDPGRNFGICTLGGREAWVFSGTLPKEDKKKKWRYGVAAFNLMQKKETYYGKGEAVVEGAAHSQQYGQSDLGHIRMGFTLGLHHAGHPVDIIAPNTIRSQALGKGNLGGLEVWPEIDHNAGDAVACALYAAGLRKDQVEGSHLT